MATKQEKLELYLEELKKFDSNPDTQKLEKIVDLLGPSIFNNDSETVACSDKEELERIKNSSVIEKLGLNISSSDLEEVCEKM
jgi:hypothetical protein